MKKKGKTQGKSKDYNDRLSRNRKLSKPVKRPKRRNPVQNDEEVEITEPPVPVMTTKTDEVVDSGFLNRRLGNKIDGSLISGDFDGYLVANDLDGMFQFT